MRRIALTHGAFALVDDQDFLELSKFKWRLHKDSTHPIGYAVRNLRPATLAQNAANSRKQKNTSSRFKGVCWDKKSQIWQVHITIDCKAKCLGRFESEVEAARAYDVAAQFTFGEYAKLNFPEAT